MNFDQMKLVDYFLGGMLCALIGIVRRVFFPVDPARKLSVLPVQSIAVVKFLGMGSILQAAGTMAALRERFPEARLILVTSRENRAFCELLPYFDEIITLDLSHPLALARDLLASVYRLRQRGVDLLLDLEFFSNFSGFYTALVGATWSIGFATPKNFRNWIYCEVVSFDHGRHISAIFYKVAQALGLPPRQVEGLTILRDLVDQSRLRMDREHEERELVSILTARGWDAGRSTVVVNVNAGPLNLNRRWPIENFRELVGQVLDRRDHQVVLIGGGSEADYVADLCRSLAGRAGLIDVSGRISIRQLILLLARADLYLGNDSGPLHIAASCGTRTVSFFGPETPRLYGPSGPEHLVFYKELPCSPCLNVYNQKSSDCRNNRCLKEIGVEEVAHGLAPVLLELKARSSHARADEAQAGAHALAGQAGGELVRPSSGG